LAYAESEYYPFVIDVTENFRGAEGVTGFVVAPSTLGTGNVRVNADHLALDDEVIGFLAPLPDPIAGVELERLQFMLDMAEELSIGSDVYVAAGIGALYRVVGDDAIEMMSGHEYSLSEVMEYTEE